MRRRQLRKTGSRQIGIYVFGVIFALLGGAILLFASHAATFAVASEAEQGVLAGSTSTFNDPSGSNGAAVRFGALSSNTLHYTANVGSGQAAAVSLGYNLLDITGSTTNPNGTKSIVDALPNGVRGLVWVGNLGNAPLNASCPAPGFTNVQFQSLVDTLNGDSKVYGYFLADEPHPSVCPNAASDIKARADYIHAHAPAQKSFIVVLDGSNACPNGLGCEYNALQPSKTDVDLFGIDPYPCHYNGTTAVPCDNTKITGSVQTAEANGIPAAQIVPVFQTFGQEGRSDSGTVYYRTPTVSELTSMISTWNNLIAHPAFDYAYTYGVQCSANSCPAPQAISNHPELQTVVQAHNAGN
ncbi:MAG TPA: hypothetical protein VLG47_01885 [Candidatus Saccharimonadales bacterium]|nr:hypothetical protein [Candidatus Saccharimonadales bacterium]